MNHNQNKDDFEVPNRHHIIDYLVFNGYSIYDALSLKNVKEKLDANRKLPSFSNTAILSNYRGETVFSLFKSNPEVLQ